MNDCDAAVWLARCLAPATCCPTAELVACLPPLDWDRLLGLAHAGLVATQLLPALRRRGLEGELPPEVQAHLEAMYTLNLARNATMRGALHEAVVVCNRLGVEPVALKGALALLPDAAPEHAARLLGDLDLLVPEAMLERCWQALQSELGYGPMESIPWDRHADAHHHAPPLYHPRHGVRIELHRQIFPERWQPMLPASVLAHQSELLDWDGARLRRPVPTHRALHNLVHTLLTDGGLEQGRLELRQVYDLVLLRQVHEQTIDWSWLRRRLQDGGQEHALYAYLLAARALFGQPLPEAIRPGWRGYASAWWLGLRWRPRPTRWVAWVVFTRHWSRRAARLPRRLCTPSWYVTKYHARRRGKPW